VTKFGFFSEIDQGYLHTKYSGELSVNDVLDAVKHGNNLYPDMDSLVDFSEASLKKFSLKNIQRLVGLAMENEPRGINCVFVAPNNLEFGLSRMYATIADETLPQNRAVFRSLEQARAWLTEQREIEAND
jgi:hypothetical protein